MYPNHEETDTKIINHIYNIDVYANFIIRCSDTKIAAMILGNIPPLKNDDSHVWILTRIGNKVIYIDNTKVYGHEVIAYQDFMQPLDVITNLL